MTCALPTDLLYGVRGRYNARIEVRGRYREVARGSLTPCSLGLRLGLESQSSTLRPYTSLAVRPFMRGSYISFCRL